MNTEIIISERLRVVDQRLEYITVEGHYRVGARGTRLRSSFECSIQAFGCCPHPKIDFNPS